MSGYIAKLSENVEREHMRFHNRFSLAVRGSDASTASRTISAYAKSQK